MSLSYGMKSAVALALQNSFGTPNVTSLHFIPFLTENVGLEKPPLISENLRGVFDEGDDFSGPAVIAGELEAEAQPLAVGAMISAALNAPTTVTSDAIFTHTWEPPQTDFDNFSATVPVTYHKHLNDTGSAQTFGDLNAATLEFSVAAGEFLKVKNTFVGASFRQEAAVTPVYPTGRRWTWAVGSFSIGGVAIPQLMDLTLTLEQAIEASHTIDADIFPNRIKRTGFRTLAIEGTMKFDDQDEFQDFIAQDSSFVATEEAMIFNFVTPTEIQSGFFEQLTIECPLFKYREYKPVAEGPGQIEVGFTAAGKFDVGSNTAMRITLINSLAGY